MNIETKRIWLLNNEAKQRREKLRKRARGAIKKDPCNQHLASSTPNLLPIQMPRKIVTSTCTTSPEMSAGGPRSLASSILPRNACALAQRVPRCHTNVIIPRNPPSVVLVCIQSRDIRAVEIHADTVGAAGVTIAVTKLDGPIQEVGGTAVSAVVSRGGGVIGLSIGNSPGVDIRPLAP